MTTALFRLLAFVMNVSISNETRTSVTDSCLYEAFFVNTFFIFLKIYLHHRLPLSLTTWLLTTSILVRVIFLEKMKTIILYLCFLCTLWIDSNILHCLEISPGSDVPYELYSSLLKLLNRRKMVNISLLTGKSTVTNKSNRSMERS